MEDRIDNEAELLAWIEGELAPDDARRVSERLTHDPELSRLLHELRADRALLRQLGEVDAPEDLLADAQHQLERTLLLDAESTGAAASSSPTGATRRGVRFGTWGSLAAVLVVAVTLGITWKLGILRTGPAAAPPHAPPGGSSVFAARDASEPEAEERQDAVPLTRAVPAERGRIAGHGGEMADGEALGLENVSPREGASVDDSAVAAADATAPTGAGDDAAGESHLRFAAEEMVVAKSAEAPAAGFAAAADASLLAPAHDPVPPVTPAVLVWQDDIAVNVELPVLEDRAFQSSLRLVVSNDPGQYLLRNSRQVAVAQPQRRLDAEMAESMRATPAADPAPAETRLRQTPASPEDEVSFGAALQGGATGASTSVVDALDESLERSAVVSQVTDLGQIWLQAPGGELYELRVPMRELPDVVAALNTPTQVAWLEFDPRSRYEAARRRLVASPSVFWWRQEVWDESRTRTIYTPSIYFRPLPSPRPPRTTPPK